MTLQISRIAKTTVTVGLLAFALAACGGGSGLGPNEITKREDKLKDRLPDNWNAYEQGNFDAAIADFTKTLQQADINEELSESIRNQVKSEAHNGIGWSFFKTQSLDSADVAFARATRLDRRNADAWAGWAGVAFAKRDFGDASQRAVQALEVDGDYSSDNRFVDETSLVRPVGHDDFDVRHVRLLLAEAYFHLGRYSSADREDPNNATAQLRLARGGQYTFTDPGDLLEALSGEAQKLKSSI
jgi:tetratricopeptide (TPR) repeat protein